MQENIITPNTNSVSHTNNKKTLKLHTSSPQAFKLSPRFKCDDKGVYYIGTIQKDGETHEAEPIRLSDSIYILGKAQDIENNHHVVLQYRDSISKQERVIAMPKANIGIHTGWQYLQSKGISIMAGRRKRELLADYLQTQKANKIYRLTNKSGWHGNDYILPSGVILSDGNTSQQEPIIYNGDKSQAEAYQTKGTLSEWQSQIAQYVAGNSRLCLALGVSLASPLLSKLGQEAGGFHLYGDSRDGKTTAVKLALSVWADPENAILSWKGTSYGFDNIALAHHDSLLVLDEIGQAKSKVVADTAYSVINGTSKIQGKETGGNRKIYHWRTLLLSTGEQTLRAYVEKAKDAEKWNAGQAARLPDIPSDAKQGLGIYNTLHGFSHGSRLSEHLSEAMRSYHGTAGQAMIQLLQQPQIIEEAKEKQRAFMATLPDLDKQARTVALRFALVSSALEIATSITGLSAGVGMAGVKQCFDDWLELAGTGSYEDKRILEQATDFMQKNADTPRFSNWNDPYTDRDHAGYKRPRDKDIDEYWILPLVFNKEICQNYDPAKVCAVLHSINWLEKPKKGWQHQKYGKGRYYVLLGMEPPEPLNDH